MANKKYIQLNTDGTLLEDSVNIALTSELAADTGADLIGVDDTNFSDIVGTTVQEALDSIDNFIAGASQVDSVNGQVGTVIVSANDLLADHSATNYTATNANIDGHLAGIDNKLASIGSPLNYKGSFDASAGNFNALAGASVGDFYKVTVAGTIGSVTYDIGDSIIVNKDVAGIPVSADIDKIDSTDKVDSVNGQVGAVVLDSSDIQSNADLSALFSPPSGTTVTDHLEALSSGLFISQVQNNSKGILAGEAITTGDPVYVSTLDSKVYKCRADDETCLAYIGVSDADTLLNGKTSIRLLGNTGNIFSGLTSGQPVYIAPTGGITQTQPTTAGHFAVRIGVAGSAIAVRLEPVNSAIKRA